MSFMYCHNVRYLASKSACSHGLFLRSSQWWHMAFYSLELGDLRSVQSIFDERLWLSASDAKSSPLCVAPKPAHASAANSKLVFARSDRADTECQLGALNLLWKWEIRSAGAASGNQYAVPASAAATTDREQSALRNPALDARWADLVEAIGANPPSGYGLFCAMALRAWCRAGVAGRGANEARAYVDEIEARAKKNADEGAKWDAVSRTLPCSAEHSLFR